MSGGSKKLKGSISFSQFDLEEDSPEIKPAKFKKDKKILYQKQNFKDKAFQKKSTLTYMEEEKIQSKQTPLRSNTQSESLKSE